MMFVCVTQADVTAFKDDSVSCLPDREHLRAGVPVPMCNQGIVAKVAGSSFLILDLAPGNGGVLANWTYGSRGSRGPSVSTSRRNAHIPDE